MAMADFMGNWVLKPDMTKKGDNWIAALLKLVFLILSVTISGIVSALFVRLTINIVGLFVVVPYWVSALIRLLTCMALTVFLLYISVRRVGFRVGKGEHRAVAAISSAICCGVHLAVGVLFSFSPFWSGAVNYLAGLITYGSEFTDQNQLFAEGHFVIPLIIALLFEIGYGALMVWAEANGAEARRRERLELTGSADGFPSSEPPREENPEEKQPTEDIPDGDDETASAEGSQDRNE